MDICCGRSAFKGASGPRKARGVSFSDLSVVLSTRRATTKNSLDELGYRPRNPFRSGAFYAEPTKYHDGCRAAGDECGVSWGHQFKCTREMQEARKVFKGYQTDPKRAAKRTRAIAYLSKIN